jgi:hypothetical protein
MRRAPGGPGILPDPGLFPFDLVSLYWFPNNGRCGLSRSNPQSKRDTGNGYSTRKEREARLDAPWATHLNSLDAIFLLCGLWCDCSNVTGQSSNGSRFGAVGVNRLITVYPF